MNFLSKLVYPIFGILVLFSYASIVRRGIEPFEVSSDKRAVPTGASQQHRSGYRRSGGIFFYGGFGGK
ncbi:MAG: hypothetical protein OEZ06_14360 [Myxococcales bacterium]|nr:hypothetical protein [Myxococcales bacterium]